MNCTTIFQTRRYAVLIAALSATACLAWKGADGPSADLMPVTEGMTKQVGYYMPQKLMLTTDKPSLLKKEPKYVGKPMYGLLHFGSAKDNAICVVLDETADASSAKMYVDASGDGDLTNDAAVTWQRVAQGTNVIFHGEATLTPKDAGNSKATPLTLSMYRFAPDTAKQRNLPTNLLLYYRDYGQTGKITLGEKTYAIAVMDEAASGHFDGFAHDEKSRGTVSLLIDRDGDGKFNPKYEMYDAGKPFTIAGVTYEVASITPEGSHITLKKSDKTVAEVPIPADLSAGHDAVAFTRPLIGGKTVNFPGDYKGKIVLLDFWATWCPPCRAEIPGQVKVYSKYHDKGFEILGISLDQPNQLAQVQEFMKGQQMTWPEVYDGKYWSAEVAKMYGIDSIPHAFLVDGTTGKILVDGEALRGEALDGQVAKALAGRKIVAQK